VFPAFLDTAYPLELQFTIMFMTIVGIVAAVHGVYACLALRMRQQLLSIKARRWMARFSGLSFLGFGAALAVDSQR
jgi:threonine/homoserine/homoserine lactone efflux protein